MKNKYLLITGGTGGHVLPAQNFDAYLKSKNLNSKIIVDQRGVKYLNKLNPEIKIFTSYPFSGNLIKVFKGLIYLMLGIFFSLIFILKFKPNYVISFGSYSSAAPVIASIILKKFLKIRIYIHEQNTVLGRANSFFSKYAEKIFLNLEIKNRSKQIYYKKSFIVGTPGDEKIIKKNLNKDNFTIFIYGGSQGSKYLILFIIRLLKRLKLSKFQNLEIYIQCPDDLNHILKTELQKYNFKFIIKEYYKNINEILKKTSIIISRSGAGTINDIIKYKIPSILIPLPTAKDNHQYLNAKVLNELNVATIIDQDDEDLSKAINYIDKINNDNNYLSFLNKGFSKINIQNTNELMLKLIINE